MDFRFAHRPCSRIGWRNAVRALCLALVSGALSSFPGPAFSACGAPSGLVRVMDVNERLEVALTDGRIVRLAGLDAPSPGRGSAETVRAARQFLAERLAGRLVELDLIGRGTDRWGRLVADLSILGTQDRQDASTAAALLAAGYARVRPEFETRGCSVVRLDIEANARRAGLGIWRDPAFAVISASDLLALRNQSGEFVVIEGRVRTVGFTHSRIYLDLVPRGGPTVVVSRKLEGALARMGRPVGALAGETIEARGALDDRFGPRIEVSEPAMIELVRPHEPQD